MTRLISLCCLIATTILAPVAAALLVPIAAMAQDFQCDPKCGANSVCVDGVCRTRFSSRRAGIKRGLIDVKSTPAGARVWVDRRPQGVTPVSVDVAEGDHNVKVSMDGYDTEKREVAVNDNQTATVDLALDRTRSYPANPVKKAGHALLWPGAAVVVFAGVATHMAQVKADAVRDGDWGAETQWNAWRISAIAGYAAGGAAVLTGIIVLAAAPSDKAWWKKHQASLDVAPAEGGALVSLGARW